MPFLTISVPCFSRLTWTPSQVEKIIQEVENARNSLQNAMSSISPVVGTVGSQDNQQSQQTSELAQQELIDKIAWTDARLSSLQIAISTADVLTIRPFERHMYAMFNPDFRG